MSTREHWEQVYATKAPSEVSWYAPHLEQSLRLVEQLAPPSARVIDVGGGASTLVDDLLDRGYRDITLLDISQRALELARARLGEGAARVHFIAADITTAELEAQRFDLWHDRAVFHFLTREADRQAYRRQVLHSLTPGGHLVIATFAPTGPSKCSGLDVMRYDAAALSREFGAQFALVTQFEASHRTPADKEQRFSFCVLRRG